MAREFGVAPQPIANWVGATGGPSVAEQATADAHIGYKQSQDNSSSNCSAFGNSKEEKGMAQVSNRPLHLHTLETLCADLVAGFAIELGVGEAVFSLGSPAARSVLAWYLENRSKWAGNVFTPDVDAIVDAASKIPTAAKPVTPAAASGLAAVLP